MEVGSDQFALHYVAHSPFSQEESAHQESFPTIVAALSRAFLILQNGGSPTLLIHDNAVLFSGDELRDLLVRVPQTTQPSILAEEFEKIVPEALISQLVKTVKASHEHFGAVAVYRSMLEELYEAADRAIKEKDLEMLHKITGKLAFWYVPTESDVRQWGKDFLHAYRRDAGWLHDAKRALERIEAATKELEVAEGSRNADLKDLILKAAEKGLITHV